MEFSIKDPNNPDDGDEMDFDEGEESTGDNWLIVESAAKKIEFDPTKMNEKIKRETESMRSSPSTMVLSGKKN